MIFYKINRIKFSVTLFYVVISLNTQAQDIWRTACEGNITRLDSLLNDNANINMQHKRGASLLHFSVFCNQVEVFDLLIDRRIDVNIKNNRGNTALAASLRSNNETFFNRLIKLHSNDEIIREYSALLLAAIRSNNKTAFNHFIKLPAYATISEEYSKLFFTAVRANNEIAFNHFINLITNEELTVENGASLLERAVQNENLTFVKGLIGKGVELNVTNDKGSTPLEIALRKGFDEIADYLKLNGADESLVRTFELNGAYMGQENPGLTAKIFVPGFISTSDMEKGGVFHPNGKEFYFSRRVSGRITIMVTKMDGNKWSNPAELPISGNFERFEPFITKDGSKLYYTSRRPLNDGGPLRAHDVWVLEREGDTWGEPNRLGNEVNSDDNEWFPTISDNGNLYFSRGPNILYSENKNGTYQKPIKIEGINNGHRAVDAFIAPDESYMIFASAGRPEGLGGYDLYVSFKDDQGKWSTPKNMGKDVNSTDFDWTPSVTPDGKYLFYMSNSDIYWVDAKIIEDLK